MLPLLKDIANSGIRREWVFRDYYDFFAYGDDSELCFVLGLGWRGRRRGVTHQYQANQSPICSDSGFPNVI